METATLKKNKWRESLPTWRRACAQFAPSMPAKLWWVLGYHIDVRKPLSLSADSILKGALCSLSLFLRQHLHDLFLLPGCGAIACRKKLARAQAQRFKNPYMFIKHPPKFGAHW